MSMEEERKYKSAVSSKCLDQIYTKHKRKNDELNQESKRMLLPEQKSQEIAQDNVDINDGFHFQLDIMIPENGLLDDNAEPRSATVENQLETNSGNSDCSIGLVGA